MRRTSAAASILAFVFLQPLSAQAAPVERLILVTLDGTSLADWRSAELPALNEVLTSGAVALLSTPAAPAPIDVMIARAAAYRALGAGRISATADPRGFLRALDGAMDTVYVLSSRIEGAVAAAILRSRNVVSAPDIRDPSFPTGIRADVELTRRLIEENKSRVQVVDFGDTARVEAVYGSDPTKRDGWMRFAMRRADALIGLLRTKLTPNDTLVVASLTPPQSRLDDRLFVAAIAMVGPRIRPGLLTGSSTEREGVVTIPDVTTTILHRRGIEAPAETTGRVLRVVPRAGSADDIASLEHDLLHAADVRPTLSCAVFGAATALVAVAFVMVVAGRGGRAVSHGVPRRPREWTQTGLVAVAAAPLGFLVEPLMGTDARIASSAAVFGFAVVVALATRAAWGAGPALAAVSATTAGILLVDLSLGGRLVVSTALSTPAAESGRFAGLGGGATAVLVSASLLAIAWALDRFPGRHALLVAGPGLAALTLLVSWTSSRPGTEAVTLPAFMLFVMFASGRRRSIGGRIAVLATTIVAFCLAVVADALAHAPIASAAARLSPGIGGGATGWITGGAVRTSGLVAPTGAAVTCAAACALIMWRRSTVLGRALWGRPATRAAFGACGVASIASVATGGGVTAAAWAAVLAAGSLFAAVLAPENP